MKLLSIIILALLALATLCKIETRTAFFKTTAVLLAILSTLWIWHAAGIWPFK